MHIVTTKGDANSIAMMQCVRLVGYAIVVTVSKAPQFWNAGIVNAAVMLDDAGPGAIDNIIEAVRHW